VLALLLAAGGYATLKTMVLRQLVGTVVAQEGELEDLASGESILVRDETILRSPVTGTVTLTLGEGTRARKDAEIASLSDTEERQQAEAGVAQFEADLAAFNANNDAEEKTLVETIVALETETVQTAAGLRAACLASDFERIGRLTASFGTARRAMTETGRRLVSIRNDRAAIETSLATARAALSQAIFPVLAPGAGIISYSLDGLEETLTPESIGQYTTKQLLTMARRQATTADQTRVHAGDAVAKLIGDGEAYVSVIVPNSEVGRLTLAREVVLRFPGFEGRRETVAFLHHIGNKERNGYCVATYRTQEFLDGMASVRQVKATIVVHIYRGIIVPLKAVVRRGGQDGVFTVDGAARTCHFRPVTVVGGSGDQVVVEGLPTGTEVVSNPWLVKEGLRIGLGRGARGNLAAGPRGGVSHDRI
jgi:putative membrane fusion protein